MHGHTSDQHKPRARILDKVPGRWQKAHAHAAAVAAEPLVPAQSSQAPGLEVLTGTPVAWHAPAKEGHPALRQHQCLHCFHAASKSQHNVAAAFGMRAPQCNWCMMHYAIYVVTACCHCALLFRISVVTAALRITHICRLDAPAQQFLAAAHQALTRYSTTACSAGPKALQGLPAARSMLSNATGVGPRLPLAWSLCWLLVLAPELRATLGSGFSCYNAWMMHGHVADA